MNPGTPIIVSALLIMILSSCQGQNENYEYSRPKKMNDGWQTESIETSNINHILLEDFFSNLDKEIYPNTHSVIIVKDNKLIFEKYMNGFDAKQRQYTASVSKSAGSVLTGIAIQQGLIEGINEGLPDRYLYELFPEYEQLLKPDSLKSKIRFQHALSMSGGLQWDENTYPYSDPRNDWIAASHSDDPFTYLFEKEISSPPGSTFNYNGGYSLLLSKQVQDASGSTALTFAKENLFKPLKIKDYEWESLDNGLTDTDGGLHLRPRDMAKIGQLYLNNGKWNGEQIVDSLWITESTKEQITSYGMPNYGYQWWCGTFHTATTSSYTYFASGHGGQKIFVFPEYEAVIVITHQVFDNDHGEINNIRMLSNYIVPAMSKANEESSEVIMTVDLLNKYVGTYENESESFEIVLEHGQLFVTEENRPNMVLLPLSDNSFTSLMPEGIEVRISFTENEDQITGLNVNFYFRELSYIKIN